MVVTCSTNGRDEKYIQIYNTCKYLVRKLKRGNHSEDLVLDGRVISEWILGKQGGRLWVGFIWFRTSGGRG
jgi:hypothetical protein